MHLRNYFGRLLRTREEFPMLDIADSARSLAYLLPPTLVNDPLLAFGALLIDAVADLRQQVRGENDSIETLRRKIPDWEHRPQRKKSAAWWKAKLAASVRSDRDTNRELQSAG